MRIVEINMMHVGSTGKIMFAIAELVREAGYDVKTLSPRYYQKKTKVDYKSIDNHKYFGTRSENYLHLRLAQITGFLGCFSAFGTQQLLYYLRVLKPDIVHLHNLHNWTINHPMLFRYLRKNRIPVVWTMHDCWSFTGKCPYFTAAKCDKWKKGCSVCTQIREYPQGFIDNSKLMYRLKKKWFTGIENMVLVTPSNWLADLLHESYLREYPVRVINNGIDMSVFSPMVSESRIKYGIPEEKYIVLGVAFGWGYRKGLDTFLELAKLLSEDYQIVLVGTDENIDHQLPKNIVSIHRTHNQRALAELYSAADVFVNPTREDNFPTVNIEALACGTPVITFDTGGSPEIIDETCGMVVPCDDVNALKEAIIDTVEQRKFSPEMCIKRASSFDMKVKFKEYVTLFENITERKSDINA